MIHFKKLALRIVLSIVLLAGILLTGCGRETQPIASTPDPCTIALTPHQGTSRTDKNIIRLQGMLRQTTKQVTYLERLGWAFVAKARNRFDPGFYTLAEQAALCMTSKNPDSTEALLLRGHVLNQLHRFREAEVLARQLVNQRGLPYDYGLLGDALTEQGKIADAVQAYDHMLQQKPGPQGYIRAAHVRWLTGDLDGAIQLVQMATSGFRDPEASAWSHVRLALYELQAGEIPQATQRIIATLAARPDYAPALAAHGRLLVATGNPESAIKPLRRAIALDPLPESQWLLIEALNAAGRSDEALAVEQTLLQRGETADRRTTALYLATAGRAPETALQLAQAELGVREDVLTLDALAWALQAAGKYREARDVNIRAMKVGTRDARLFYHAGVIAAAVGEHEEASRWFAKATAERQMLLPSEQTQLAKAAAAIL